MLNNCNYRKLLQQQSGFTLVELIVGITLLLIILSAIYSTLTVGTKSYQYNLSQAQNIASAQELLNVINTELKYATEISIPAGKNISMPNSQLTYKVENEDKPRSMNTITGTPSTTNSLVISHNNVSYKTVVINNLRSITLTRVTTKNESDSTYINKLIISATLNNQQYTNSPTMDISTTVILPNIKGES